MKKLLFSKRTIALLRLLVAQNKHIDFRTLDTNTSSLFNGIRLDNIAVSKEELAEQLKAFQRILRVTYGYDTEIAWLLLYKGFSSAIDIAALSKNRFAALFLEDGMVSREITDELHKRARAKRAQILPQYMNMLQNSEPHIRNASI